MIYIPKKLFNIIVEQAKDEFPNECCGIVAGKDGWVKKVYKLTNVDASPESFSVEPKEQLKVMKEIRNLGLEMLGIYHSHVASFAYPSNRDVELAFYPDAYYLIISLKEKDNPQIRAFKIREGKITEEEVKLVDSV